MKLLLLSAAVMLCMGHIKPFSQNGTAATNKHINAAQFDFWLGEWNLTWNDSLKGTNTITKELGGYVIQENFHDPVSHFSGRSWSVYDTANAIWKQTWVDNQGGYIVLTGRFENEKMILATQPVTKNNKIVVSRMVFYNIKQESFDWNWEHSTDGGNKWILNWKIHYQRRK